MAAVLEAPETPETNPKPAPAPNDFTKQVEVYVMERLGKVPHFIMVKAIRVFDHNYRVNVWVRKHGDPNDPTIGPSFFVTVNWKGKIVDISPEI